MMWYYQAINDSKQKISGIVEASDENDLRNRLLEQNYYVIRIRKRHKYQLNQTKYQKISTLVLANFCRHWAAMISSGIELNRGLAAVRDQLEHKSLRNILTNIYLDLVNGYDLYQSFSKFTSVFSPFFINMLKIGEETGKLNLVLKQLVSYYEKDYQVKQKVKNAFQYPKILLILCFLVLMIMLFYILPLFNNMFLQLGGEMPRITILLNQLSRLIKNFWPILGIVIIGGVLGFKKLIHKKHLILFDRLKLNIPFYRNLYQASISSRFVRGLSILICNRVELVSSLEAIIPLMENKLIERRLIYAIKQIKEGMSFSLTISKMNLFPVVLIEILRVGEASGNLSTLLEESSQYFDEQVSNRLQRLTTIIEPLMILTVAGIIVLMMVSIFFPLLRMMDLNM